MSRYVDMPGHRGDISLGDVHILRSEFVVDLSDISHTAETRWVKQNDNEFCFAHILIEKKMSTEIK